MKIAIQNAAKNKWVQADKTHVERKPDVEDEKVEDATAVTLREIAANSDPAAHEAKNKELKVLKKRKLIATA